MDKLGSEQQMRALAAQAAAKAVSGNTNYINGDQIATATKIMLKDYIDSLITEVEMVKTVKIEVSVPEWTYGQTWPAISPEIPEKASWTLVDDSSTKIRADKALEEATRNEIANRITDLKKSVTEAEFWKQYYANRCARQYDLLMKHGIVVMEEREKGQGKKWCYKDDADRDHVEGTAAKDALEKLNTEG